MSNDPEKKNMPSPDLSNGALKAAMPEGHAPDPSTHRILQTRNGTVAIPRKQEGVPLAEYFSNAELPAPDDMARARVFETSKGLMLVKAEPEGWTQAQDEKAKGYAAQIREQIDTKGYYSKTLAMHAKRMAEETGLPPEETKAVIVREFENLTGRDPYNFLNDLRAEQGLPAKDRAPQQDQTPAPERG